VTSAFAEENILTILIGGATIYYGGKYLERAWGSSDFGKFMLVVTAIPNLAAGLLYILAYAASGAEHIR
jgi:membrane associated rhomboid family serine protease